MKIKRQKRVDRFLSFFKNNFGFRAPYQVLIDGTFCQSALKGQMNVRDQVSQYLGGHVKLLTTCCAVVETEKLGNLLHGANLILKQFPVHKCGHEKQPTSAFRCFMSMVKDGNRRRYIVASQDSDMRLKLRRQPGIPLLYVHYRGPLLEKPSTTSNAKAKSITDSRFRPSDHQASILNRMKKEILGDEGPVSGQKKKKKVFGKKTKEPNREEEEEEREQLKGVEKEPKMVRKRRRRQRVRLPSHVKEHLAAASVPSEAAGGHT